MTDKILFPDSKIIVTKYFDVHQDWTVPISGFFIIESLRKIKSIAEFTDEEALEFTNLLRQIRQGMQDTLAIKEVYLFQNEDSEHGFHFWIFPRHSWMESFGKKIQSVRPIINHAKENMLSEDIFNDVNDQVQKMKVYLSISQKT